MIDLNRAVNWTRPEHLQPYRGLFKVRVLPPDDLLHPVIAERLHGKLVSSVISTHDWQIFHLCHQCAVEVPKGCARRLPNVYTAELGNQLCTHTAEQRSFVTTISSVELELALRHGYRVSWCHSIFHWAEWTDKLLRPYVQDMMRLKIQVLCHILEAPIIFCCRQAVGHHPSWTRRIRSANSN